jgi:hypothetical protein
LSDSLADLCKSLLYNKLDKVNFLVNYFLQKMFFCINRFRNFAPCFTL